MIALSDCNFKNTLKNIKLCVFDLDGTLYIGDKLIDGATTALDALRKSGKKILFLTNNSSSSSRDYEIALRNRSLFAEGDEVFSSLKATCLYLLKNRRGKRVFALATPSALGEIESYGIELCDNADIALLTFDKTLTYDKIVNFNCHLNGGAEYIATHLDLVCPSPCGPIPDAGSFAETFYLASKRRPDIVIGKPSTFMGEAILDEYNLKKEQVMMFGDRLYTDIRFANNCGFYSTLVLSGETNKDMANNSIDRPTFVLESVKDITKFL